MEEEDVKIETFDDLPEIEEEEPESQEDEGTPEDKFTLEEEEKEEEVEQKEEDLKEIVHNGQVYKLTEHELKMLAQKGFDYDTKVGPHAKIAQMITADPGLANVVDDYWKRKSAPKDVDIKPIADYEDETEWLKDNINKVIKGIPEKPQKGLTAVEKLRMRDPNNCDKVIPRMAEFAGDLSVKDYQRIDSSETAFYQFYDYVKGRVTNQPKTNTPPLKIKSGGGNLQKETTMPVWNLSKEAFQKELDKVKGF